MNNNGKYKSRQFMIILILIIGSYVFLPMGYINGNLAFALWSLCIASWTGREWMYKKFNGKK